MPQGCLEAVVNTDIHDMKSSVDLDFTICYLICRIGQVWVVRDLKVSVCRIFVEVKNESQKMGAYRIFIGKQCIPNTLQAFWSFTFVCLST